MVSAGKDIDSSREDIWLPLAVWKYTYQSYQSLVTPLEWIMLRGRAQQSTYTGCKRVLRFH